MAAIIFPIEPARSTYVAGNPWSDDSGKQWIWNDPWWEPYVADLAAQIYAADEKTDPVDDDWVGLLDSENNNVMKKVKKSKLGGGVTQHATLMVGTGDAAVTYEAVAAGSAGEAISIAYAAAAVSTATTVALTGSDFVVTPGAKAAMVVSGITGDIAPLANAKYYYSGTSGGKVCYTTNGIPPEYNTGVSYGLISFQTNSWSVAFFDQLGDPWFGAAVVNSATYPDGLTYITDIGSGTAVVTAANSSAKQVSAAVNAQQDVAAQTGTPKIIVATIPTGYDGSSAVVTPFTHTHLSLT